MSKYDTLFEDEDDVFLGSPQSKFWDILNTANDELVKDQMDLLFEKFTIMETLLTDMHGEEKLEQIIKEHSFENSVEVEFNKKSTYMEFTGEIISRLDS